MIGSKAERQARDIHESLSNRLIVLGTEALLCPSARQNKKYLRLNSERPINLAETARLRVASARTDYTNPTHAAVAASRSSCRGE